METTDQQGFVARLGADLVQGWAIAHPMPLADVIAWVREQASPA